MDSRFISEIPPDVELEKIVGGPLAVTKVLFSQKESDMIVNESAIFMGEPVNRIATQAFQEKGGKGDIHGTVIILENIDYNQRGDS